MSVFYKNILNPETKKYDLSKECFKGCVLALREHNGFDDSDYYALVYDKEKDSFYEVEYATTRFACSSYAVVDATPEIVELYRTRAKQAAFRSRVHTAWEFHQYRLDFLKFANVSFKEANKLFNAYGEISENLVRVGKLLHTKNFRSDFRKNMAEQVRAWLKDENPKYKTPLSPRQLDYCCNPTYNGDSIYKAPWNEGKYASHLYNLKRFGTGFRQL